MTTHFTHTQIDESKMFSAIDIGTTKVVALTGYRNEQGKIEILGHGVVQSKNLSINKEKEQLYVENIHNALETAVMAAHKEAGFFCKKVVVGTAGRFMRSYQNRIEFKRAVFYSPITVEELQRQCDEKINELVAYDEEILHIKKLQYIVDEQFYNEAPVGKVGSSVALNVCIIKVKKSYLQQLRSVVEQCGMEVVDFMLEPLASGAAVLTENDRNAGCTLVDIGGGTTDVAMYEKGNLQFAEVVPFGGNTITNDIRQMHIKGLDGGVIQYSSEDWKIAEQIKIQYGKCLADESEKNQVMTISATEQRGEQKVSLFDVVQTIQNRMDEIIDAIHELIEYSGCTNATKQGIVLTGGGAELKDVAYLFEQKLHCTVRVAVPHTVVCGKTFNCNHPRYATVVGLLMRAAEIHACTYVVPIETPQIEEVEKPQNPVVVEMPKPSEAKPAKPQNEQSQLPTEQTINTGRKGKNGIGGLFKKAGEKAGKFASAVFSDDDEGNEK